MKNIVLGLVVALSVIACGGSDGSSPSSSSGAVLIKCADVVNEGTTSGCTASAASGVRAVAGAITVVDAGVVSRGTLIEAHIALSNTTAEPWFGYYSIQFDAGCAGAPTWDMATMDATPVIGAGSEWSVVKGGACGDMPLGNRIMTVTTYDTDPSKVLGVTEVRLVLVE